MDGVLVHGLSALLRVQNDAAAFVLAACAGLALLAMLRAALGQRLLAPHARRASGPRWRRVVQAAGHLTLSGAALGLGSVYAVFVFGRISWGISTILVTAATLLGFGALLVVGRVTGWVGPRGVTGGLTKAVLLLSLLVVALLTLMTAGFLALTEDRPVLLVELTGATGAEEVSWAPPGGGMRTERLTTHEVIFRRPSDGAMVGRTWVYGDEIAIKGRVLRLSPLLNAAGIPNLFELTFAFTGYRTLDRHNSMPHRALPLEPVGPLSVHPMWRRTQAHLLRLWETKTAEGSTWLVRSATTESSFFPMVDPSGRPVKRTFRLVLTPGGLSAS